MFSCGSNPEQGNTHAWRKQGFRHTPGLMTWVIVIGSGLLCLGARVVVVVGGGGVGCGGPVGTVAIAVASESAVDLLLVRYAAFWGLLITGQSLSSFITGWHSFPMRSPIIMPAKRFNMPIEMMIPRNFLSISLGAEMSLM